MSPSKFKCPLCGHEFEKGMEKCHACPMSEGCNMTCCPNCGYSFTNESKLVGWLKKKLQSASKNDDKNSIEV